MNDKEFSLSSHLKYSALKGELFECYSLCIVFEHITHTYINHTYISHTYICPFVMKLLTTIFILFSTWFTSTSDIKPSTAILKFVNFIIFYITWAASLLKVYQILTACTSHWTHTDLVYCTHHWLIPLYLSVITGK